MKNHHMYMQEGNQENLKFIFTIGLFFWSIGLSLQSQRKQQIFFFPFDESCQHLNVSEEKKLSFIQ